MTHTNHLGRIRIWLGLFIAGLVLSGITAFPLQTELSWLVGLVHAEPLRSIAVFTRLGPWIETVN
jgi:hypothetical protein